MEIGGATTLPTAVTGTPRRLWSTSDYVWRGCGPAEDAGGGAAAPWLPLGNPNIPASPLLTSTSQPTSRLEEHQQNGIHWLICATTFGANVLNHIISRCTCCYQIQCSHEDALQFGCRLLHILDVRYHSRVYLTFSCLKRYI
ncbi:uncharacterized protein LOC124651143 [Lolium rigidum]|uniref:uncharacterized protein LOC124651143 n=1 Tax=Lolium rigidum TaxID=89674 RepID=UPI001F5CEA50|nr:uncharacterized protein LOC124651143 [Lolium rigidum]